MRTWKIKVTLRCGKRYIYIGLFKTACDAVMMGLDIAPDVASVTALRAEVQA